MSICMEVELAKRFQVGYIGTNKKSNVMTTLTVRIDERSRRKYRVSGKQIAFEDLRRRIIGTEGLGFLRAAHRAAAKVGLNTMTRKDVEREIKSAHTETQRPRLGQGRIQSSITQ